MMGGWGYFNDHNGAWSFDKNDGYDRNGEGPIKDRGINNHCTYGYFM